ncbi:MAG: hypothetical protein Q8900_11980 [Bacillota bacterium]|nr:hypothetical protein [Bacillota bacterium]
MLHDVGSINNLNIKKIPGKLSFNVGEIFSARVLKLDAENSQALLKMTDGWQFSAKIANKLDTFPEGLIKFQVEGNEGGTLNIRLVKEKNDDSNKKSNIKDMLLSEDVDLKKEDFSLLDSMVKHNMPLSKENISNIKTLINFKNKFSLDDGEQDKFINNYLEANNIDKYSENGKKVEKVLKDFISEYKNFDEEDILTLVENGIDLTEDNLKSYNKLFKEQSSTIYKELEEIKNNMKSEKLQDNDGNIKQQIKNRIDEMKQTIKEVIDKTSSEKNDAADKILNLLTSKLNDFKVFNSVSNQYYYMDLPVNVRDNNYDCKIIIKDDRKSGKKIDSKNVKLVISINTNNLGIIDAYIKVNDKKMNVDLKCDDNIEGIFKSQKDKMAEELSTIGYDVSLNVSKKNKEVSLVNCREFFNDVLLSNVDVLV